MNTEKKSNRKEWVKNVAIIFLSVMLVLTFFSNTIMNYSLPEVATAIIEPGSITAKIRGTGNLTSDDPYKITIQESRKIASVAVKQGDVVEKGQVLFYLEDEDSAELEQAEEELEKEESVLEELLFNYSLALLKEDVSNEVYVNAQNGKVFSNDEYQSRISVAKQNVESAKATVESLEKQIAIAESAGNTDVNNREKELEYARNELEKADEDLGVWREKLSQAQTQSEGNLTELTTNKYTTENEFNTKKSIFNQDTSEGDVRKKLENAIVAANLIVSNPMQDTIVKKYEDISNINEYMAVINQLYISIPDIDSNGGSTENIKQDLSVAMHDYIKAYEETFAADLEYQNASKALETAISASVEINSLQANVNNAENYADECRARVKALENSKLDNNTNNLNQKADLELQKANATIALKNAEDELTSLVNDIGKELSFENENNKIKDQKERIAECKKKIEKLKGDAVGATITAPIAGTVTNINKIAGESITPNEELAIMQPEGKGFSMSFTVTPEQAKKVTVGEQAEIQNSWYYNDITATLAGIRPDPESNGAKKLLVFNVTGDVQVGQSVSVSIGQKSANYDLLVPNSAVREDNNGKFILIVEAKNSPLGNRYIATRVDVEVLGSDDNKTAINAPLYGYEYVITTATQPVEAGKQVRLAEN
mgnify:CR=1 FL=1